MTEQNLEPQVENAPKQKTVSIQDQIPKIVVTNPRKPKLGN